MGRCAWRYALILWLFGAVPAAASPLCGVVNALLQAQKQEVITFAAFGQPGEVAEIRRLSRLLQSARELGVSEKQFLGDLSPNQTKVLGYISSRAELLMVHLRGGHDAALRHVADNPNYGRYGQGLQEVADDLDCRGALARKGDGADRRRSSNEADLAQTPGQLRVSLLTPDLIFSLIMLCSLGVVCWAFFIFRSSPGGRKAKRYRLNRTVEIVVGRKSELARVIDISRSGAQISTPSISVVGENIEMSIGGVPRAAQIVWSNQHYAGLKFDEMLSQGDLSTLLKTR